MVSMNSLDRVGLAFAGGNEVAQTGIYVLAPRVGADLVAFIGRRQPNVRKAKFGFAVLPADFKNDVGAGPLSLVLDEIKVVAQHVPYDFLARHKLGDFERGAMNVFSLIEKYRTELVGIALDGF